MPTTTLTIEAIIENETFINHVRKEVREILSNRNKRPKLETGFRYKRDWLDRMNHEFSTTYCLKHIADIWRKQSKLNREQRSIILYVCNKAYQKTFTKPSTNL